MKEPVHTLVVALGIVLFFLGAVMPPWQPPSPPADYWRLRIISAGLFCVWLSTIITA
jgi:hypothetical protein